MLTAPGVGSGLDINSLVSQLVAAERAPAENRLSRQESRAGAQLSAFGQLNSALSTFQSSLASLKDVTTFQGRLSTSSDEEIVTVTADETAQPSAFEVEVTSLAKAHKIASAAFADTTTPIGTGTLSITVDGETAAIGIIEGVNSLGDIQNAINNATDNPGVRATIVTADDGAHLVISSLQTGLTKEITIATSGGDGGLAPFVFDPLSGSNPMSELDAATDAVVEIDGFTVNSASNTLTDAIEGVTLELLAAAPGTVVNGSVSLDEDGAQKNVASFVTAYNSLMLTINELTAFNADSDVAGTLLGDSSVRSIKSALRNELSGRLSDLSSDFSTLSEIGVTTTIDGNLEIDAEKLGEAISADFNSVGQLFGRESDGIAVRLDAILESALSSTGQIQTRQDTLNNQLERVKDQRAVLDLRMEAVQQRLSKQFNAMDRLLSELSNTSNYLAQQLGGA